MIAGTALAFAAAAQASPPETHTLKIEQLKNCTALTLDNCKANGMRAAWTMPSGSGFLTIGIEKFKESAISLTGTSATGSYSYVDGHTNVFGTAQASASMTGHYAVSGERLTVDKSFKLGTIGPAQIDARIGLDLGQIKGNISATGTAQASVIAQGSGIIPENIQIQLNNLSTPQLPGSVAIPPALLNSQYGDRLSQFNGTLHIPESLRSRFNLLTAQYIPQPGQIPSTMPQQTVSMSESYSEFWNKEASTPYGGLSAGIQASTPITNNLMGIAGISGRLGAEKTTSTVYLGAHYVSPGSFHISAGVDSTKIHRDALYDAGLNKTEEWATRINTEVKQAAADARYNGTLPTVTNQDIMNALVGKDNNPYQGRHNRFILEAGKQVGDWTFSATYTRPLENNRPSTTTLGASLNF